MALTDGIPPEAEDCRIYVIVAVAEAVFPTAKIVAEVVPFVSLLDEDDWASEKNPVVVVCVNVNTLWLVPPEKVVVTVVAEVTVPVAAVFGKWVNVVVLVPEVEYV